MVAESSTSNRMVHANRNELLAILTETAEKIADKGCMIAWKWPRITTGSF